MLPILIQDLDLHIERIVCYYRLECLVYVQACSETVMLKVSHRFQRYLKIFKDNNERNL